MFSANFTVKPFTAESTASALAVPKANVVEIRGNAV